jgi:acyl transferase domain-containing protein
MQVRDIPGLCRFIARQQVSMIASAPQLVNELNKALRDGLPAPLDARELLSSLRIILVGGDRVKAEYVDQFLETAGVYNTYGPTESTVCATYYRCPDADQLPADVPIGKPLARYRVYIYDKYGMLSPIGVGGELCVTGPGITRGYLNHPQLTNQKFFRGSRGAILQKSPPGRRRHPTNKIYKTGDLARWQSDGNIEFLGRIDRQVKIRGYRIELAGIESHLTELEHIKEAVVVEAVRQSGENYLAAYVVCPGEFDAADIKSQLARNLPDYMIPPYIMELEEIPWTELGKVDRKRLPLPGARSGSQQPYAEPGTGIQKKLAGLWKEILELDRIGLDDNFFDLGGTSLDIIKLNTRIKETFDKQIPVASLFQYTTVRSLAGFLGDEEADMDTPGEKQREILDAIEESQQELKDDRQAFLDIAITGMACRFPGAGNVDEYWKNLAGGVESISFFSDEELLEDGVDADTLANPNYVKAKGIIEGAEYFDASFFGYTPLEARIMDPQMRVFLQCAWHALEDAGYDPYAYNRRIGLYAGASANFAWEGLATVSNVSRGLSGFMVAQLADKDFMCTHISYKLDLKGPAVSLQTACSTSLVAIHYAARGLLNGECEMALAGGVSIVYPPKRGYLYQEGMIFSPDGHNRSFDAEAKGSIFGDGVGVVVLKKLDRALADRDNIYALVKGTAVNNDGLRKVGYTAPGVDGQMEVIRAAQLSAGVEPGTVTYIEAHGTATPLGDSVEIEALKQAFSTTETQYCALGSVKSNFGHLYSAAGAAGFIKTALALKHRLIPPTLHFNTPNPQIDFNNSPFYVNTQLKEWQSNTSPLRAGVSSFGIGGTNAHAVLEEAPEVPQQTGESRQYQLMVLSAKTPAALEKQGENIIQHLKNNPGTNLADMAYTLQVGRGHFPYRRMHVFSAIDVDLDILGRFMKRMPTSQAQHGNRPVIFMFCGQGSQYVNMGLDLYQTEPAFRKEIDRCFRILEEKTGINPKAILYPEMAKQKFLQGGPGGALFTKSAPPGRRRQPIDQPEFALPVIFSLEYALARLLISWGVKPAAMIGYSFGEYVAACISGVFSLEDALRMITIRGRLIQRTPAGAMTSVTLPEHVLRPLLNSNLSIAIVNGPTCIVSGREEHVRAFEEEMKQKRIICVPLNMSHAVHSKVMEPIRQDFEQAIAKFQLNPPRIPFISNVTANWCTDGDAAAPSYWGDHLCSTVRFSDGLTALLKNRENAIFVEIGPGRILGMMVRVHPGKKPGQLVLNTLKHPQEKVSDDYFLLDKLGQLWLAGQRIDWRAFYEKETRTRISLPGYPFEGKRYWIDPKTSPFQAGEGMPAFSQAGQAEDGVGEDPGTEIGDDNYEAPRNELEQAVARLWQEFMGVERVGIHDDFFYLNGSSLVATQIIARLNQEYQVEIPMERFYETPTIANLARLIDASGGPSGSRILTA